MALSKPKYPGDAVKTQKLQNGAELGSLEIKDYGCAPSLSYQVAAYIPGREVWVEGDTPKTEPEVYHWCHNEAEALQAFDSFLKSAEAFGWKVVEKYGFTS